MSKKPKRPEQAVLDELRERLGHLRSLLPSLSRPAANKAMAELLALMGEIENTRAGLDPIKEPGASFDPTNPDTAGRLVALALVAQDKVPMARIARTYGSGVYAIYYTGAHPAYASVSGTETPIYVGKADPKQADARTAREQGPQLYGRLADHRRMIRTVGEYAVAQGLPNALRVEDFQCRRLVCATNAQLVAERHLIGTFKPIWNNEVGICWGISKHGDAAKTRKNKRSPWDVMHPGRSWAMDEELEDKMSPDLIVSRVAEHFVSNPPHRSRVRIVRDFLAAFTQNAAMTPGEEVPDDDAVALAAEGEPPTE
ncbi:Eco29kI family restriction endonuclease [Ralstonia solanacearum]|uniref:Eco29kI family restriction endonuclease n=1 Tax=Ralstonia solanacearum TaxID=305 RepID=UPI000F60606C|nr:Eco29kI family restriction endonuclease [Ralstonia solanacearum]